MFALLYRTPCVVDSRFVLALFMDETSDTLRRGGPLEDQREDADTQMEHNPEHTRQHQRAHLPHRRGRRLPNSPSLKDPCIPSIALFVGQLRRRSAHACMSSGLREVKVGA